MSLPSCPQCDSEYTYADGDTITVIKDLKVKGLSSVVKVGTKLKNIRQVDGDHTLIAKLRVLVRCY